MVGMSFGHGGNAHVLGGGLGKELLDFSANINPYGLPKYIKNILFNTMNNIVHYPDPDYGSLLEKISDYWRIPRECILLGNGSVELLYLIASVFRSNKVLINAPSFSEYERAARINGSDIVYRVLRESNNFDFINKDNIKADIEFICNPNNPTGNLIIGKNSTPLFNRSRLLVVDEAFMDFVPDEKEYTLVPQAAYNKNLVALRTFTKIFAIPGLRIGYLVSHKSNIVKLKKCLAPWNINVIAQKIAENMIGDIEYLTKSRELVHDEKTFLINRLNTFKELLVFPSAANWLLIKIRKESLSSTMLKEKLITKNILIRNCNNFHGLNNKYFRIAVRTRSENRLLIKALGEVL